MRLREIGGRRDLRRFVDLAWRINERDPMWVPPLRKAVYTVLDPHRHPFHQHAEVACFLAERDGRPVGRIAAVVNRLHNEFHDERTGFFGLFEAEDDAGTAALLLDGACAWLRERGMERVRGPVNLSTNEEISSPGVLVDGFDTPPAVMMSHNPPYYGAQIESAGFEGVMDLFAYRFEGATPPERMVRNGERLARRAGITVRPLDLHRFEAEVEVVKAIYNAAWSHNWGFVPMTEAEFEFMARELKPVIDPELCYIVEAESEPVGFLLALPDFNQALRFLSGGRLLSWRIIPFLLARRRIDSLRVLTLGFRPGYQHLGLGAYVYLRAWLNAAARGYRAAEASWILETNDGMRGPLLKMGGDEYKRYRIFEKPL